MDNNKNLYKGNEDFFAGQQEDFVQQRINSQRRFLAGLLNRIETKPKLWSLILGVFIFFGWLISNIFLIWIVFSGTFSASELVFLIAWAIFLIFSFALLIRLGVAIARGFFKAKARDKIVVLILFGAFLLSTVLIVSSLLS
jgi:hypothetical protein